VLVYVYNNANNTVEAYNRNLTDPMPYVSGRTLTLGNSKILVTQIYYGQIEEPW